MSPINITLAAVNPVRTQRPAARPQWLEDPSGEGYGLEDWLKLWMGSAAYHGNVVLHVVSRDEALSLLHSGRINSAAPIIALQWLELNRPKLLERWEIGSI